MDYRIAKGEKKQKKLRTVGKTKGKIERKIYNFKTFKVSKRSSKEKEQFQTSAEKKKLQKRIPRQEKGSNYSDYSYLDLYFYRTLEI